MSYALREPIQYLASSIGGAEVDVSRLMRQSDAVHELGEARIGAEAVQMRGRFKSELQESKPVRLRSSLRVWR